MELQGNSGSENSLGEPPTVYSSVAVGVALLVILLAIPAVFASPPEKSELGATSQFQELTIQVDDDEITASRKASLLRSLNSNEIEKFTVESAKWIPAKTGFDLGRWVRSVEVLLANTSFREANAKAFRTILARQEQSFGLDGRIRALSLRLLAKSREFDQKLVAAEFRQLKDVKVPSAYRLAALGAITDGMQEAGLKPSVGDLEQLLSSDVYEIRMHAVDWFRILTFSEKEQIEFLKVAIKISPYQVRERVYRQLNLMDDKVFAAVHKEIAGAKNGVSCVLDKSEVTRRLCEAAQARAAGLEKKGAP